MSIGTDSGPDSVGGRSARSAGTPISASDALCAGARLTGTTTPSCCPGAADRPGAPRPSTSLRCSTESAPLNDEVKTSYGSVSGTQVFHGRSRVNHDEGCSSSVRFQPENAPHSLNHLPPGLGTPQHHCQVDIGDVDALVKNSGSDKCLEPSDLELSESLPTLSTREAAVHRGSCNPRVVQDASHLFGGIHTSRKQQRPMRISDPGAPIAQPLEAWLARRSSRLCGARMPSGRGGRHQRMLGSGSISAAC